MDFLSRLQAQVGMDHSAFDAGVKHVQHGQDSIASGNEKAMRSMAASTQAPEKAFASLVNTVGKVGMVAAGAGVAGLAAGLGSAVSAAAGFEQSMGNIRGTLSQTDWAEHGKQIQATALQLGKDYPLSASEAANAMEMLAQKGISANDIISGGAKSVVEFSTATGSDLVTSAGIAAAAMDTFGVEASDMGRVTDLMAASVLRGGMSATDFGFAMKAAGAVINLVGGSVEDASIAFATMAKMGIEGSDAGTSLKSMYMSLIPSTNKQSEEFNKLGLLTFEAGKAMEVLASRGLDMVGRSESEVAAATFKLLSGWDGVGTASEKQVKSYTEQAQQLGILGNKFFDAEGKVKSFEEVGAILSETMAGLTEQQRLQSMEILFGTDGIKAASAAANLGSGQYGALGDSIRESGIAAAASKAKMDTLQGSWGQLTGSLQTAAVTFGLALTPGIKAVADSLTAMVNDAMPQIEAFATQTSAWLTATALPALQAFSGWFVTEGLPAIQGFAGQVQHALPVLAGLGAAFLTFQVATTVAAGFAAVSAAAGIMAGAFTAASATGGVLAGVLAAVGGPITLITIGVGLLAAAWIGNWGDVQGKTAAAGAAITATLDTIAAAFANPTQALTDFNLWTTTKLDEANAAWVTFLNDTNVAITTGFSDFGTTIQAQLDAIGVAIGEQFSAFGVTIQTKLAEAHAEITRVWDLIPEDIRTDLVLIGTHISTEWERNNQLAFTKLGEHTANLASTLTGWNTQVQHWSTEQNAKLVAHYNTWMGTTGQRNADWLGVQLQWVGDANRNLEAWSLEQNKKLTAWVANALKEATAWGKSVVDGARAGLIAFDAQVTEFLLEKVRGLIAGVKGLLGIGSPSTIFASIGADIVAGLSQGFLAAFETFQKAALAKVKEVTDLVNAGLSKVGSMASGGAANKDWRTSFGFNQPYANPFNPLIPRHRGIDLVPAGGGGIGTPVGAFNAGEIVKIGRDTAGPGGLMVWIKNSEGLIEAYMHLAEATTKAIGATVAAGEVIGKMGESGTEGSPHLHYEVRRNPGGDPMDQLIDPRPYMTRGQSGGGAAYETNAAIQQIATALGAELRAVEAIVITSMKHGLDPMLSLAFAKAESQLNPMAVGDSGASAGLFQLHQGGMGAGMSLAQRQDPWANAERFLGDPRVQGIMRQVGPTPSPGQVSAAGSAAEGSDPQYAYRYAEAYQAIQQAVAGANIVLEQSGVHIAATGEHAHGATPGILGLGTAASTVATQEQTWAAQQANLQALLTAQTPLTQSASAALQTMAGAIAPLFVAVDQGTISTDQLAQQLVTLAANSGLTTEPLAQLQAGNMSLSQALNAVIREAALVDPAFASIITPVMASTDAATNASDAFFSSTSGLLNMLGAAARVPATMAPAGPAIDAVGAAALTAGEQAQTWQEQMVTVLQAILAAVEKMSTDVLKTMETMGKGVVDQIAAVENPAAKQAIELGQSISEGVAEGIKDEIESVANAAEQMVHDAMEAANTEAGSESPSKVWRRLVGQPLALGVALGLRDSQSEVEAAARQLVSAPQAAWSELGSLEGAPHRGERGEAGEPIDYKRIGAEVARAIRQEDERDPRRGLHRTPPIQLVVDGKVLAEVSEPYLRELQRRRSLGLRVGNP